MSDQLGSFSREEFQERLAALVKTLVLPPCVAPSIAPHAVLLGGQSGAGKTTLHQVFRREFKDNVIVINGDEYRSLHPRFRALQNAFGDKSVDYTAPWAGRMTEALVEALSAIGYNLIIEGTLRTAEVPLKTAMLLRERGYGVSLALMAVKPDISLVSCQLRYEEMRIAGTTPRATDPTHHKKIVDQIVSNLRTLEESQQFEGIYLYTRAQRCLYPREGCGGTASDTLKEALFGPWTEEERRHYEHLKAKLLTLQTREAPKTLRTRRRQ